MGVLTAELAQAGDAAAASVVDGHEVIASQEEVDVARGEPVLLLLEIDAVQDQIQVLLIRLDLRELNLAGRVLDRQRMEAERIDQNQLDLVARRLDQVDPQHDLRGWREPRRIDPLDASRLAVAVNVDANHAGSGLRVGARGQIFDAALEIQDRGPRRARLRGGVAVPSPEPTTNLNQSPTRTESAACAAARRATGTR